MWRREDVAGGLVHLNGGGRALSGSVVNMVGEGREVVGEECDVNGGASHGFWDCCYCRRQRCDAMWDDRHGLAALSISSAE
ncbi:MAG TPA: hypothetical protein VGH98_14645 [Gemmatimonadaceae bacterium]